MDSGVRLRFSHEAHNRACCQKKIALTKAIFFFSEINPAHLRAFQVSLFQLPKVERVPCAVYQPVQLLTGGFLVG